MKIVILFAVLFCFSSFVFAQTAERKLETVEKEIAILETSLNEAERNVKVWREELDTKDPKFIAAQSRVNEIKADLIKLNLEKKKIVDKNYANSLPNNQIELLKMIVIQNDTIIDLLEKLIQKP